MLLSFLYFYPGYFLVYLRTLPLRLLQFEVIKTESLNDWKNDNLLLNLTKG